MLLINLYLFPFVIYLRRNFEESFQFLLELLPAYF